MFSLKEAISSTPQHPKSLRDNKLEEAGGELRPSDNEDMPDTPQTRRFHLLDGMALIAATAIGFAIARAYALEVLNNNLGPYPVLPRALLTIWAYILAALPIPVMWSIAVFLLHLRRPRPRLRLLADQPGFAACGAVALVAAIRLIGFLMLLARTIGNRYYTVSLDVFDSFSVTVSYPGPVNSATIQNSAYFAVSAFSISAAVAAAWLLLAVGGHWRSESHWLDRLGRVLGAYWIGIIPFSCWWDYHILY
jgi:hypothetical protein